MIRNHKSLDIKPEALCDLRIGDWGYYPSDDFHWSWIGHDNKNYRTGEIEDAFIPRDLADEWAKRLTGRNLENKQYIIVQESGFYPYALYMHDDMVGLIKLIEIR